MNVAEDAMVASGNHCNHTVDPRQFAGIYPLAVLCVASASLPTKTDVDQDRHCKDSMILQAKRSHHDSVFRTRAPCNDKPTMVRN